MHPPHKLVASTDNGAIFGPVLTLASNGTIGEEGEEEEVGTAEE